MSYYLNVDEAKFISYFNDDIFVDKSKLISITNKNFNKESSKYMCVTRPRRFGKTLAISMLNAYYSKGANSKELFDKLDISRDPSYEEHLNKHNLIWIDMSSLFTKINVKESFVDELKRYILMI